ncbi:MAG: hypothetical protein A2Z77_03020 [Chloroflexi bacterium RBG_13_51_36]|nr:MAG: hypothetical protein A2Z77_03020 [Chloroflexi bacterium RBG_13_51_36]
MQGSKLLITGGAGSIGKELVTSLARKGYQVRAFDIPQADFSGLDNHGVEVMKGDITDRSSVRKAVKGCDLVLHLAALLPPVSEISREKTFAVNVDGTSRLVDAIVDDGARARMILTSTVATYGDTTADEPPIRVNHPQRPNTVYSETKVEAEKQLISAKIPHTILRVSGVVMPVLMDPPKWPFMPEQRVEFISRADVVAALLASVEEAAAGKIFHIAGGRSWQMRGKELVAELYSILDIPAKDAEYPERPVYCDWYDTDESQAILNYQRTPFPRFLELLNQAVEEALV